MEREQFRPFEVCVCLHNLIVQIVMAVNHINNQIFIPYFRLSGNFGEHWR